MLFVLLGRYDPATMTGNLEREGEVMESPPEGIEVVARYTRVGGRGGFIHIVKADNAGQLAALLLRFVGLVEYEVIPIVEITGTMGVELAEKYLGDVPMHGPV